MNKELMKKLLKAGSVDSKALSDSVIYKNKETITTDIPSINIALGGTLDSGLTCGLTVLAGPSRHFKSNTGLFMVAAYLKKYDDAICLFYDSEYGAPPAYWANFGIDTSRVVHIPLETIEDLKFDLPQKLAEISREDHVIVFIDSVGNLASKKEAADALDSNAKQDMTRAKEGKSLWRIVTPSFNKKDIPCIAIGHTYQTIEMFSKAVLSGGTGIMYSANNIWIFGRAQEKDDKDLMGFRFTINIEKSRFVKEKSKIPLLVLFDKGISKYSGILELALEFGIVQKPKNGYYQIVDMVTGEYVGDMVKEKNTQTEEFLGSVMRNVDFKEFIREKYQLPTSSLMTDEDVDSEVGEIINDDED